MGCSGSKDEESLTGEASPRRSWGSMQPVTPSSTQRRLVAGLQDLKRQMDEDHYDKDAFSFTKIILKLGTIEQVLRRVKAVFKSVDHGNKGHVTKDELKEGLHKAQVDLGPEWKDTNIDECLQHLQGSLISQDQDKVGIREFVVMLAVGRVCRPLKRRSTVFVPLPHQIGEGGTTASSRIQSRSDTSLYSKTIDEDEVRRTQFSVSEAAAAAAAEFAAEEEGEAKQSGHEPPGSTNNNSDVQAANDPGRTTSTETAGSVDLDDRAAVEAAAAAAAAASKGRGVPVTVGIGPGGLPKQGNWRKLKWRKIPSIKSLDVSVRGMSKRGFPRAAGSTRGRGSGGVFGGGESEDSMSVKYVLDLFIAAYFQFDPTAQGFITRKTVEKILRQPERESGASALLDERRWSEVAWEGDRLSFQEYIYAFAQWLGLMEDDDDDNDDDDERYTHQPPTTSAPARTPASAPVPAQAPAQAPAAAPPAAPAPAIEASANTAPASGDAPPALVSEPAAAASAVEAANAVAPAAVSVE